MARHIKVQQYLDTMCSQIRYQKIHAALCKEVENHIQDQQEAFQAQGLDEETATSKAVAQMGDPLLVGAELDRVYRPRPEWSIITLTGLLLLAGICLRFFCAPPPAGGWWPYCRQLLFPAAGIGLLAIGYCLDFTFIGRYAKPIFLSLAAVAIVMVSWPRSTGVQTLVSCLLLLFPAAFAGIVYGLRDKGYGGLVCCGILFAVPAAICMRIPNAATLITLAVSCLALMTVAIAKNWFGTSRLYGGLLVYLPPAAVMAAVLSTVFIDSVSSVGFNWRIAQLAYRIKAAVDLADPLHRGSIGTVVTQILSGARLIGQGTLPSNFSGMPTQQLLPGMSTNFLLTYTIHRFGWLAFGVVVVLSLVFLVRALSLCARQKSVLAVLVSTAAVTTMFMQMLFYTLDNFGFYVFAPLSWPLISQSGPYLLINMCLVGVLLSVFKTGYFLKDQTGDQKASPLLKFEAGKLIIDFNVR